MFSKIKNVISNLSNKEEPLISFIVPVYDARKEDIKKAFKSIVSQPLDFSNLEVIFVNDKSHKTAGITVIKGYEKKYDNVKLYDVKVGTLSQARNYGLKQAKGKYVMFLNAGDHYNRDICKLLYDIIEAEFADVVGGNFIDLEKSNMAISWKNYGMNSYKTKIENIAQDSKILSLPSYIPTKIYRKSFLDKNQITFDESLKDTDKLFNYQTLLKANGIIFLNEVIITRSKNAFKMDSDKEDICYEDLESSMAINNHCYDLVKREIPQDTHVILNDANAAIKDILKTNLTREQLQALISHSRDFFDSFLKNNRTAKDRDYVKIAKYIANDDFQNAYYKYIDYRNEETVYKSKHLKIAKPKMDSYEKSDDIDVSVIIPIYNGEKYLDSCLNSIHDQTLESMEIICIDDNSTDSTYEILMEHRKIDKRIRIIHSKAQRGLTATRNTGIKVSKGKYFTFVDCDDWLDSNTLKEAFSMADSNDLDLYMFYQSNYTQQESKISDDDSKTLNYLKEYDNKLINKDNVNLAKVFKTYNRVSGKLYSRSFIINNKIKFNPKRTFNDDNYSIISFIKAENVMFTTKSLYNKRIHDKSHSSKDLALLDIIFMLRDVYIIISHVSNIYNKYKSDYFNYMIRSLKNNFNRISPEYKNIYFNHAKQMIKKAIVKYELDDDIRNSLNSGNLRFYDYMISSISSNDPKFLKAKDKINTRRPISIVIYSRNLLKKEINEIISKLLNQKMDFSMLELVFVDNKSLLNTNHYIDDVRKIYPNINHIMLDHEFEESRVYELALKYVDTPYVMFLNPKLEYTRPAIISLFKTIHGNSLNVVSGSIENADNSSQNHLIWTKIFSTKFIKGMEPKFKEEINYEINVEDIIYKQKGVANIHLDVIKN